MGGGAKPPIMSIQNKYFYTTVSQLRSVSERLRLKDQVGVCLLGGGGGIVCYGTPSVTA